MTRTRVLVIGGGTSCEHEVGLASARAVADGLDAAAYDTTELTISRDGRWRFTDGGHPLPGGLSQAMTILQAQDVVIPAVHGPGGEDGTLAALCVLAGVPCVGSDVGAGALAMNKWVTKLVAGAIGVRTAAGVLLSRGARHEHPVLPPWPVVVKPTTAGSSLGVARIDNPADLEPALDAAFDLSSTVLVEEFVTGREIDVAVLDDGAGGCVLGSVLEIMLAEGTVFDATSKYDGNAAFVVPAVLDPQQHCAVTSAALRVFTALGCSGLARIDFFLTDEGLVLNEVNTMPGLTSHSQAPRMFAAAGLPYPALLDALIAAAIGRSVARPL